MLPNLLTGVHKTLRYSTEQVKVIVKNIQYFTLQYLFANSHSRTYTINSKSKLLFNSLYGNRRVMCDDKYQREEVVHEVCGQIVDIHPTHILVHVHVHCIK